MFFRCSDASLNRQSSLTSRSSSEESPEVVKLLQAKRPLPAAAVKVEPAATAAAAAASSRRQLLQASRQLPTAAVEPAVNRSKLTLKIKIPGECVTDGWLCKSIAYLAL